MSDETTVVLLTVEGMVAAIGLAREKMDTDEELGRQLREGYPSGNPITLGPRLPPADVWADRQVAGAQANAQKWLDNTTHPKKNFQEEALRPTSVARYKDSMQRVINEDLWEGGMALVNTTETMATITAGGSGVYSGGVARRKAKIRRTIEALREERLALCALIDGMDVTTEADRENKMIQNVRGMRAIGRRRRGAG